MTVGLAEAARRAGLRLKCSLAVDFNEPAIGLLKQNFPNRGCESGGRGGHSFLGKWALRQRKPSVVSLPKLAGSTCS